jgi:hypothetical protein
MYDELLRRVQNTAAKVKRSITVVVRQLPEEAFSSEFNPGERRSPRGVVAFRLSQFSGGKLKLEL